jgi:hypothetical protein
MNGHAFDDRGHGAALVDQREQVRLGEQLAERLQTTLPSAHAGEPVVDQRNFGLHGAAALSRILRIAIAVRLQLN